MSQINDRTGLWLSTAAAVMIAATAGCSDDASDDSGGDAGTGGTTQAGGSGGASGSGATAGAGATGGTSAAGAGAGGAGGTAGAGATGGTGGTAGAGSECAYELTCNNALDYPPADGAAVLTSTAGVYTGVANPLCVGFPAASQQFTPNQRYDIEITADSVTLKGNSQSWVYAYDGDPCDMACDIGDIATHVNIYSASTPLDVMELQTSDGAPSLAVIEQAAGTGYCRLDDIQPK